MRNSLPVKIQGAENGRGLSLPQIPRTIRMYDGVERRPAWAEAGLQDPVDRAGMKILAVVEA